MNIFDEYILFLIVERKSKTTWNVINYNNKKIYNIIDTGLTQHRLKLLAQRLIAF